jgi:hypothetical protein
MTEPTKPTENPEQTRPEVTCDAGCKQPFTLPALQTEIVKAESIPGRIEKYFFLCPHCSHDYIAYYTDPEIRNMQEQVRKIKRRIEQAGIRGNYDRGRLALQHDRLKRQIGVRMRQLRWRVEVNVPAEVTDIGEA